MKPTLAILILLLSCQLFAQQDTAKAQQIRSAMLTEYPLLTWLRKSPVDISCMLESQLGYQDRAFRCGTKYVNKGDPCKKTKEYYEGLQIPENIVPKIHPMIKSISLSFEHGELQQVTIEFKDSMIIGRIRSLFAIPANRNQLPANVMDISYGEDLAIARRPDDLRYSSMLDITGFDHMGSGDVDCK